MYTRRSRGASGTPLQGGGVGGLVDDAVAWLGIVRSLAQSICCLLLPAPPELPGSAAIDVGELAPLALATRLQQQQGRGSGSSVGSGHSARQGALRSSEQQQQLPLAPPCLRLPEWRVSALRQTYAPRALQCRHYRRLAPGAGAASPRAAGCTAPQPPQCWKAGRRPPAGRKGEVAVAGASDCAHGPRCFSMRIGGLGSTGSAAHQARQACLSVADRDGVLSWRRQAADGLRVQSNGVACMQPARPASAVTLSAQLGVPAGLAGCRSAGSARHSPAGRLACAA